MRMSDVSTQTTTSPGWISLISTSKPIAEKLRIEHHRRRDARARPRLSEVTCRQILTLPVFLISEIGGDTFDRCFETIMRISASAELSCHLHEEADLVARRQLLESRDHRLFDGFVFHA